MKVLGKKEILGEINVVLLWYLLGSSSMLLKISSRKLLLHAESEMIGLMLNCFDDMAHSRGRTIGIVLVVASTVPKHLN
ncbi:hypothetical protein VNO77_19668 [Canavalia gladiata]|uniref:Uncharacterized protein n=1 Tax=Canavalia gladiata TaxID=3824 RepID=A0AAN9LRQ5_CANGL